MLTFDQSMAQCNQKLAAILLLIDDLKREKLETERRIHGIVAKLQEFQSKICDEKLESAVRVLDQILSEFGR